MCLIQLSLLVLCLCEPEMSLISYDDKAKTLSALYFTFWNILESQKSMHCLFCGFQ